MKHYHRTLLDIEHKVDTSQVGACAACCAAPYHGTKEYAKQAVAKHRAVSQEVRRNLSHLLRRLDDYDARVEAAHARVVALRFGEANAPEELT